ncbi:hypothetical protein GCM10009601_50920 [Streptomyces thermospinosisporus]|uniref:Uncharacterized protein n=1 Tax=Streptomyces thermospinosisporus TaxID=161482 RepID=A0ABP4JVD5_9ACTN
MLAQLRPEAEQPVPGLLPVPGVVEHHDLADPCQQVLRRHLPLPFGHRTLRTARPLSAVRCPLSAPTLTAADGDAGQPHREGWAE